MRRPEGRANFSLPWSWGFRGQLEGSPERRIASAGTVHGGSHTHFGGAAGRLRPPLVREQPQRQPALWVCCGVGCGSAKGMMPGRGDNALSGAVVCLIVLAIMPRRCASDRRLQGGMQREGKQAAVTLRHFPPLPS